MLPCYANNSLSLSAGTDNGLFACKFHFFQLFKVRSGLVESGAQVADLVIKSPDLQMLK